MSARQTALNALIACRKQGAWSNGVLKEYINRDRLDSRDAALATRLCYGVIQNRHLLDFYLRQMLTGKLKDLHPVVRDILHMGLYQLYCMDKIPQSAAVNEAVALTKQYCKKQRFASGLVNGVLRNAIRQKDTLQQPSTLQDRYSHPQILIDFLQSYVGEHRIEAMLAANNGVPEIVAQVNTLITTTNALSEALNAQGVQARPHPWQADCLVLSGTGNVEKLDSFRKGQFYIQDAAARLSVLCAGIPKGGAVLDCCAAPGGKSFAAVLAGAGSVISCDIHAHKTALIQNGASRLGFDCIQVQQQDATQFQSQWQNKMDVVLADVPCSGYGIIRKKPDIREKDPKTMADLPQLQLKILENQANYVKPNGVLLYSTCTLVRAENEGVVEHFLAKHADFYLEALTLPLALPQNTTGMMTLVPGEFDTDGFFIARLRRKA